MTYDDAISRDRMDGQWDRRAEREEPTVHHVCRYCERRERQVPWPPEAPSMTRCQVCGETRAMREATTEQLNASFAALARRRGI